MSDQHDQQLQNDTPPVPAVETPAEGRTPRGTFAPGNKFAKGGARPGAGRRSQEVREAEAEVLAEFGTPEHLREWFTKLDTLSRDNDPRVAADAIGRLLDRVLGKPTQRQEVTGEDGAPLLAVKVYPMGMMPDEEAAE